MILMHNDNARYTEHMLPEIEGKDFRKDSQENKLSFSYFSV